MNRFLLPTLIFVSVTLISGKCGKPDDPPAEKPVIYLYPEVKTDVEVKLNLKGQIISTYPEYKTGWKVTANPNGTLVNKTDQREHSYLFYDGKTELYASGYTFQDGYAVERKNVVTFLQTKLETIGLNQKEANDMISYWLPRLQRKDLALIRFRVNKEYDAVSEIDISPKPETQIRVMLEFVSTNQWVELRAQKLPKIDRKGFTIVEWGGVDLTDLRPSL